MTELGGVSVSRETIERLKAYQALLEKWNGAINLVARSTISSFWERHVVDSAQLYSQMPVGCQNWLDAGSGGGLPGIVIAGIAKEHAPSMTVHLVESDQRKATFLRRVVETLDLNAKVSIARIATGTAIFPKGERYAQEIAESRTNWHFDVVTKPSLTDTKAQVLVVKGITRVDGQKDDDDDQSCCGTR